MSKVAKVHDLMHELLQWCTQKDITFEAKKTKLPEKLVGLKFSMEIGRKLHLMQEIPLY
jgi:hypothetical protein